MSQKKYKSPQRDRSHLLLETLDWLESLNYPASSSTNESFLSQDPRSQKLDNAFLRSANDEIEDNSMREDIVSYQYDKKKAFFKKWRKWAKTQRAKIDPKQIRENMGISRIRNPAWKRHIQCKSRFHKWFKYTMESIQRKANETLILSKPLQLQYKIISMFHYWRGLLIHNKYIKLRAWKRWKIKRILLAPLFRFATLVHKGEIGAMFMKWKRRSKWPKVAKQRSIWLKRLFLKQFKQFKLFSIKQRGSNDLVTVCLLNQALSLWKTRTINVQRISQPLSLAFNKFRTNSLSIFFPQFKQQILQSITNKQMYKSSILYHKRHCLYHAFCQWQSYKTKYYSTSRTLHTFIEQKKECLFRSAFSQWKYFCTQVYQPSIKHLVTSIIYEQIQQKELKQFFLRKLLIPIKHRKRFAKTWDLYYQHYLSIWKLRVRFLHNIDRLNIKKAKWFYGVYHLRKFRHKLLCKRQRKQKLTFLSYFLQTNKAMNVLKRNISTRYYYNQYLIKRSIIRSLTFLYSKYLIRWYRFTQRRRKIRHCYLVYQKMQKVLLYPYQYSLLKKVINAWKYVFLPIVYTEREFLLLKYNQYRRKLLLNCWESWYNRFDYCVSKRYQKKHFLSYWKRYITVRKQWIRNLTELKILKEDEKTHSKLKNLFYYQFYSGSLQPFPSFCLFLLLKIDFSRISHSFLSYPPSLNIDYSQSISSYNNELSQQIKKVHIKPLYRLFFLRRILSHWSKVYHKFIILSNRRSKNLYVVLGDLQLFQARVAKVLSRREYFQKLKSMKAWYQTILQRQLRLRSIQLFYQGRKAFYRWVEKYNQNIMLRSLNISTPINVSHDTSRSFLRYPLKEVDIVIQNKHDRKKKNHKLIENVSFLSENSSQFNKKESCKISSKSRNAQNQNQSFLRHNNSRSESQIIYDRTLDSLQINEEDGEESIPGYARDKTEKRRLRESVIHTLFKNQRDLSIARNDTSFSTMIEKNIPPFLVNERSYMSKYTQEFDKKKTSQNSSFNSKLSSRSSSFIVVNKKHL